MFFSVYYAFSYLEHQPYQVLEIVPKVSKGGVQFFGLCIHCSKIASKEVHFDEDGIIVVERYCDECMQPDKFESLQRWYGRN